MKAVRTRLQKEWLENKAVYVMILPVLIYYFIFHYMPMGGILMAFQDYSPNLGYFGSKWVGLEHFKSFFTSYYFQRLLVNTLMISVKDIIISFPMSIIFALLLNEVRSKAFRKGVQTVSYLPYFISMVVVCGLVRDFTEAGGFISNMFAAMGGPQDGLLGNPGYFQGILIGSNVWQSLGYNSIIYISALSAIDQELYEAARIDGAGRWKQTLYVTLPGIASTIIIMLILRVGNLMTVNYQKIILLYSPATYETGDVISTFVYRKGLLDSSYSYATAVGLFNSVINLVILCVTNWLSRKYSETSLW
ncbi:ABC transporter permease subunit [Ruminococcaceae bacterium OttesenSCG-928-L11]|nr:ABC transporter permease subunit [Ruminococcaceae bacterium OttesenSCG-928-L11]